MPPRSQVAPPTAQGLQSLSRRLRNVPTSARIPLVKLHPKNYEGVICAHCGLHGHSEEQCAETGRRASASWGDELPGSVCSNQVCTQPLYPCRTRTTLAKDIEALPLKKCTNDTMTPINPLRVLDGAPSRYVDMSRLGYVFLTWCCEATPLENCR
eukprot:5692430-Pyramimonas_sp.AAC.1